MLGDFLGLSLSGAILPRRHAPDAWPRPGMGRNASSQAPASPFANRRVPSGRRVYAIGDIHGCAETFGRLLEMIARESCSMPSRDIVLILLGDLIDRGPDSRRVLRTVQDLRAAGLTVDTVMGNHEEVLLELLAVRSAALGRFFIRIGGRETLLSYGAPCKLIDRLPPEAMAEAVELCIPPDHIAMMAGMVDAIEYGDFFFTHAGIDPDVDLADQAPAALRWIRDPFTNWSARKAKTVVHGHTICAEAVLAPGRIGIDTGAYRTGRLTALALEADRHWFLQTPATS